MKAARCSQAAAAFAGSRRCRALDCKPACRTPWPAGCFRGVPRSLRSTQDSGRIRRLRCTRWRRSSPSRRSRELRHELGPRGSQAPPGRGTRSLTASAASASPERPFAIFVSAIWRACKMNGSHCVERGAGAGRRVQSGLHAAAASTSVATTVFVLRLEVLDGMSRACVRPGSAGRVQRFPASRRALEAGSRVPRASASSRSMINSAGPVGASSIAS